MMENSRIKEKSTLIKKRRRKNKLLKIAIAVSILLVLVLVVVGIIISKKTFKTTESAVYVNGRQQILCASFEKLDKEYYKADDLKQYVESQIDLYNGNKNEKAIKMTSFKQEGKKIKLFLHYTNSKVYEEFNGQDFFVGTIKEAKAKGYKLPKDAPSNKEYKIVIMEEKIGVKVAGDIVYTSDNVKKVNDSTVTMKDKTDQDTAFIMVIYK